MNLKTNLEKLPFPELVKEFVEYYKNVPLVEEHIQEILEEAAERLILNPTLEDKQVFEAGAKWQSERMYSEEDIIKAIEMARGIREGKETFTAEDISGCTEVCTYDWTYGYEEGEILQFLQKKQFPTSVELTEDFKTKKL